MDRTEHVVKNLKFAAASELTLAVLKFVSRRVFVLLLGKEYLGINGLFTDILSVLSLAELGFGIAVTYSLYRPAALGDTELVKSLMALYRRAYWIIGLIVLAAGLSLTPFLSFFVKEMPKGIPDIFLIYVLNVLNASASYVFAYKATLLFVHQRKYVDSLIRTAVTVGATAAQIGILLLTGNYIYYMLIAIGATLLQNTWISVKTDGLYPYLREKKVQPLPEGVLCDIRRNVGAMMLHRIGAAIVFSTDNILISKFAGIVLTGLYSNYTMIRGFLNVMVNALFNAIVPALGNLNATEPLENKQAAFCRLNFFSAWLFGWMSICLLWLYDPFISIWLGGDYLLPRPVVVLIVVNFYINSMRIPVANTKSVMGLFWDERYKSILEPPLNLVLSILLAQRFGIFGILAGTLISTMALPFWVEPLGLYRHGLKQPVGGYFLCCLKYLLITAAAAGLTGGACLAAGSGIFGFVQKCILCFLIPNGVYLIVYRRTPEFCFVREIAGRMIKKIFR